MTNNPKRHSRKSFAYADPTFRNDNPIKSRAPDLKGGFAASQTREAFQASRQAQSMIDRDAPEPQLKPSPEWAADVDAQEFNRAWEAERHFANQSTKLKGNTVSNQIPETTNKGPCEVIRDGRLKATIWMNESENGPYWSTEFSKTIAGQDGNPRDVRSFSQTEVLRIAELSREAYGRVNELKRELSQGHSQSTEHDRMQFKKKRQKTNGKQQSTVQTQQR